MVNLFNIFIIKYGQKQLASWISLVKLKKGDYLKIKQVRVAISTLNKEARLSCPNEETMHATNSLSLHLDQARP